MEFKLGELFCGPGGIALGSKMSSQRHSYHGIRHAWANDIDSDACETYCYNLHPNDTRSVINKDIRELSIEKLPSIDALAFGFPCNDFSLVGKKKGFRVNMVHYIHTVLEL